MVLSILSLPSELKQLIAELISSPNSLAALALTHTAYQREAEEVLYDTLSISASSNNSLKCLETLATIPEKAALVRSLTIEYARNNTVNINRNRKVTTYLSKSLVNMHSLSDLRVKSRLGKVVAQMIKGLGKILCEGHFRLKTFYCDDFLNISEIIKSQTELQILGLYNPRDILKSLKELRIAQLLLPVVLTLERDMFIPNCNHISIFPTFYSVERRATIHQVLAKSFCKDQGSNNIRELSIFLIDSSDMPSISALAKVMAVSFPRIFWINLWFQRRCDIPVQEIKDEFSFFSNLHGVNTYVWPRPTA